MHAADWKLNEKLWVRQGENSNAFVASHCSI